VAYYASLLVYGRLTWYPTKVGEGESERYLLTRERERESMSKMKQHLEDQIIIADFNEENTGWKRRISFDYQGNNYELTLYWGEFEGYDVVWRFCNGKQMINTPDWVVEWDSEAHQGMSFEHYLDDLTWERK